MAIQSTDLETWCTVTPPEDDSSASGGAIDATVEPVFTQITSNDTIEALSDGTDTRTLTITARKADGSIVSEAKALTGTSPISFSVLGTVERILKAMLGTTDASRTVTVRRTTGPVTIRTIKPTKTGFRLMYYDSASDPSVQVDRYEAVYWRNTNGTLALTNAKVQLAADPSAVIFQGIALAKGDIATIANRLAVPAGITFVDDAIDQTVPASPTAGVLGSGERIAVWYRMRLTAGNLPVRSTFTTQIHGTSA